MGLFSQLRETLQRADTVHLRELLVRTIHKVEVWSAPVMRGRRRVFQLERGRIHLQSDQFDNLLRSSYLLLPRLENEIQFRAYEDPQPE